MVQANLFGVCLFYFMDLFELFVARTGRNTWLNLGGIDLYVGVFA